MQREKLFKTKNETKVDVEKFFKIKLSKEEFRVVKDLAIADDESSLEQYRFSPFDKYIFAIKQWGTKSGKVRNNPKPNISPGFDYLPFPWDNSDDTTKSLYVLIQDEIDNKYPKIESKREYIREHNKESLEQTLNKTKSENYSTSGLPDRDLMFGIIIVIFFISVAFIFAGGDLSPGGPKFFGHDGG